MGAKSNATFLPPRAAKNMGKASPEKQKSHSFTDEEIEEFKIAFEAFDEDGEGSIGRDELGQLLDALGENLTETEVDKMVATVDEDGSGEIDFAEFLVMMRHKIDAADPM